MTRNDAPRRSFPGTSAAPFRREDEVEAVRRLAAERWPSGTLCGHCGNLDKATKLIDVYAWRCDRCGLRINILEGTPLERRGRDLALFLKVLKITSDTDGWPRNLAVELGLSNSYLSSLTLEAIETISAPDSVSEALRRAAGARWMRDGRGPDPLITARAKHCAELGRRRSAAAPRANKKKAPPT